MPRSSHSFANIDDVREGIMLIRSRMIFGQLQMKSDFFSLIEDGLVRLRFTFHPAWHPAHSTNMPRSSHPFAHIDHVRDESSMRVLEDVSDSYESPRQVDSFPAQCVQQILIRIPRQSEQDAALDG